VEIFEKDNKIYAKINTLLEKENLDKTCKKCSGKNKNKPLIGLMIINGLAKNNNEWKGGKILDSETGKDYKCYLSLISKNKLKVRGFIGFSIIERTQYWYKVN